MQRCLGAQSVQCGAGAHFASDNDPDAPSPVLRPNIPHPISRTYDLPDIPNAFLGMLHELGMNSGKTEGPWIL